MHKQTECMGLHDKNRHDIIVRYAQVYDNEWTDAYIELTEEYGLEERQAIQVLLNILTVSVQHTYEPGHSISYKITYTPSEDSDLPAHPCSLLSLHRAFCG